MKSDKDGFIHTDDYVKTPSPHPPSLFCTAIPVTDNQKCNLSLFYFISNNTIKMRLKN